MTDSTSDEDRDDFILQERLSGRSARSIGKQLSLTVGEVNASLDRTLPKIDNELRVRYVALDLMRLDALISVFAKRAIEEKDVPSAVLVVKALERKAALLGLDQPTKLDVVQVQAQEQPSEHDKIHAAIMGLVEQQPRERRAAINKIDELGPERALALLNSGNGNGAAVSSDAVPPGGPGAVDTLSPPDDDKPSP